MNKIVILGSAGVLIGAVVIGLFFRDWLTAVFYTHDMETKGRVERLQVDRVMETLALRKGEDAADIGAGSGLFSRALARRVGPGGTVYAVDINEQLLDRLKETARKSGIGNIITVPAEEKDPRIPKPVDLIFICDTFHMVENKEEYLALLRSYLKPGGKLAILDLKDKWPPFHGRYKYTVADLKIWTSRAGFRLVEEHDFLAREFFTVFEPR